VRGNFHGITGNFHGIAGNFHGIAGNFHALWKIPRTFGKVHALLENSTHFFSQ
jgi:hypothetical protein